MDFTVRVAGGITVSKDGREMPPPPDRAVATLLLGLLASSDDWLSRPEAARRLYPESDPATARNALRQALFRLRRWMEAEITESRSGLLRLVPGVVLSEWDDKAFQGDLVRWLDHPWVDSIAEARFHRASVPHFDDFARAVESAAAVDIDAARGLLVGGSALVMSMPPAVSRRLLGLTKPSDVRSPLAFEYFALCGELDLHSLSLERAKTAFLQAYRLALGRRSAARAFRAASMAAFTSIEAGDMTGAAAWLERCADHARSRPETPLLINVRAAFLWNSGRFAEAVLLMRKAMPNPDAAESTYLLHYWTNFAALAAESGDDEAALQADAEARRLARPGVHGSCLCTLDFAQATRLMRQGRFDESLRAFEALRERAAAEGGQANRAYADEGYAEALARAGESERAVRIWSRAEAERLATSARLTPRLVARKARIFRVA